MLKDLHTASSQTSTAGLKSQLGLKFPHVLHEPLIKSAPKRGSDMTTSPATFH